MRGKVFISTTSFGKPDPAPLEILKAAGLEVSLNPYGRKLTSEEVVELAANSEGLIAGTEPLDAQVLNKLKDLRVISRCGVGMDNIDLAAAERQGIKVFNTPNSPAIAVAELTMGLMLALLRHIPIMDRDIRAGKWQKRMGNLLLGKKVGIIGFGRIGQKVAELALGLGAQVVYCDPAVNKAGYTLVSLDELLSQSDIVSLHVSGGGHDALLLGYKELRSMRKGSWLINCARGGAVDEEALHRVLAEGWLAGAAVDVFEREPYAGSLTKLENVILTPHIGSYAIESRVEMEVQAAKNLIEGLKR